MLIFYIVFLILKILYKNQFNDKFLLKKAMMLRYSLSIS